MKFHIVSGGRKAGPYTLEELRQKLASGELTGGEMIVEEGGRDVRTLRGLLDGSHSDGALPPPLPQKSGARTALVATVCVVVALGVIAVAGYFGVKAFRTSLKTLEVVRMAGRSDAVEIASRPIPNNPQAETVTSRRASAGEFKRRQYIGGYLKNGWRHLPSDAQALELIEAWMDANYPPAVPRPTNAPPVWELAAKFSALPDPQDPLALVAAAANTADTAWRIQLLQRALDAFPKSKHSAYPRLYASLTLAKALGDNNTELPAPVLTAFDSAREALLSFIRDEAPTHGDQEEIANILLFEWGYTYFYRARSHLVPAVAQILGGEAWLTSVLAGEAALMDGWYQRGGGYAHTVTPEGWEGFRGQLATARKNFEHAWKLRPQSALAPSRMIYVSLADSGLAEMREWFDRTLELQVDHPVAWKNMFWGLRPRWHGTHEAMLALGKSAARIGRFDTDVPRQLMYAISQVEDDAVAPLGEHRYSELGVWTEMKSVFEGYIAAAKDDQLPYWRSYYAAAAHFANDPATARAQFEALDWKPYIPSLQNWGRDLSLLMAEVDAQTGPLAGVVADAAAARAAGDDSKAAAFYKAVLTSPQANDRAREFAAFNLAALSFQHALRGKDWTDCLPRGETAPLWKSYHGGLTGSASDGARLVPESGFHFSLLRADIGGGQNFHLRCSASQPADGQSEFGLLIGIPDPSNTEWNGLRFKSVSPSETRVLLSRGWLSKSPHEVVIPVSAAELEVDLILNEGLWTLTVNKHPVFQDMKSKLGVRNSRECMIGLGSETQAQDSVTMVNALSVRRLE